MTPNESNLKKANAAYRKSEYALAKELYKKAIENNAILKEALEFNIKLCDCKINNTVTSAIKATKNTGHQKEKLITDFIVLEKLHPKTMQHIIPYLSPNCEANALIQNDQGSKTHIEPKKINICALIPGGLKKGEGSSYIRLINPLTTGIASKIVNFTVLPQNFNLRDLTKYDALIIQRYAITDKKTAEELILFLKKNKIKLLFDIDDALGNTTRHKNSKYIENLGNIIKYLLDNSDVAIFSTKELMNFYNSKCKNQVVIPSSLDKRIFTHASNTEVKRISKDSKVRFLYMGTRTHDDDFFKLLYPAFQKLNQEYPNEFELHILGGVSKETTDTWITYLPLPKEFVNYLEFMQTYSKLDSYHIGLSPLIDDDFNKCKTDIKILDYLAINTLPMASKVDAYSHLETSDFVILVENSRWFEALQNVIQNKTSILEKLKDSQDYIWKTRSIDFVTLAILQYIPGIETILSANDFLDNNYYKKEYKDIEKAKINPVTHYFRYGWKEDRCIGFKFDPIWYKQKYLLNMLPEVNPLIHYQLIGREQNLSKKPTFDGFKKHEAPPKNITKRACLFASYDKDNIIDETVIFFIKELSNFCDVYFLCDNNVHPEELKKINSFTKGSWAYRHGEYDFGSYRRLAHLHVGWEKLETYDEVLFVNDSSFLISSLKNVFEKMSHKNVAWWGLQATKGLYDTKEKASNSFSKKIPISEIKNSYLSDYFNEENFDFHIGSYFLAFSQEVIKDKKFQNIINSISKDRDKKTIIIKYEIGLTKFLISEGYEFGTYMDHLYPYHPVYTNIYYEMANNGFPLFKRYFLTENHYKEKCLYKWKENLQKLTTKETISLIEKNINRVADATKIYKNMDVEERDKPLLNDDEYKLLEKSSIVDYGLWIFPVCHYNHNLDDNSLAVFEAIKNDAKIKKVILFKDKHIDVKGVNVDVVPLNSRQAQNYLLSSNIIFVKHSPTVNVPYPVNEKKHKFINLWHGVPFKKIGVASLDTYDKRERIINQHNARCYSVIASSDIDQLAMAASFYPLTLDKIWITGLPRHDFILNEEKMLPQSIKEDFKRIDALLKGRRLILYAPTFRNGQQSAYFKFSENDKKALYSILEENNLCFGIREHMADSAQTYSEQLKHPLIINLGSNVINSIEPIYRRSALLITDYSSCFIDFMLTEKPMISFAYDYIHYRSDERGTFYELDDVFPGPVCSSFEKLLVSLKKFLKGDSLFSKESYTARRKIFHKFSDTKNSIRVIEMIKEYTSEK